MIGFFPTAYPDELLYSVLARYYDKSGYMGFTYVSEDLFARENAKPDVEFINQYTPGALQRITYGTDMETVILEHTMFPYYARFLPLERRRKAFGALVTMQSDYKNLILMPKNKTGEARRLRYCPVCADNDRARHGETYWHREHQMMGVDICPIHHCRLMGSSVILSGKASPALVSAESTIPFDGEAVYSENPVEIAVAEYIGRVFRSPVDMDSDVAPGDFLHSRMEGTKYLSVRGEQRNIALFHQDCCAYYKDLKNNWFTERWHVEKLLSNYMWGTYEICLAGLFLKIPVADLVCMRLPEKTQEQRFDEAVYRLHEQGLKYPAIAERLNASVSVVKAIGERRYGTYHKPPKEPTKCGVKPMDWESMDKSLLPKVRAAICQIQGRGNERPKKITVFAVEKTLGLPCKRIDNLPRCKAEILRHYESQQEYWAREVVWAAHKVIQDGEAFNWKHVRTLTNMRRRDLISCMPYVREFADREMYERIREL